MYVNVTRRKFVATRWRFILCLVVLLVPVTVIFLAWDTLVSFLITIVMGRYQPYAQWDLETWLCWKGPWELLIVVPTSLLMAIAIFVFVYV